MFNLVCVLYMEGLWERMVGVVRCIFDFFLLDVKKFDVWFIGNMYGINFIYCECLIFYILYDFFFMFIFNWEIYILKGMVGWKNC